MSTGLLLPLTWFNCETSFVSNISATQLATNTCCLRWDLCFHWRTGLESVQKLLFWNFDSCSFSNCSFNLTALTAAFSSKRDIERCRIGLTRFWERRYVAAQFMSSIASANLQFVLFCAQVFSSMVFLPPLESVFFLFRNSSPFKGSAKLSHCYLLTRCSSGVVKCENWMVQTVYDDQILRKLETGLGFQILLQCFCKLADYLQWRTQLTRFNFHMLWVADCSGVLTVFFGHSVAAGYQLFQFESLFWQKRL